MKFTAFLIKLGISVLIIFVFFVLAPKVKRFVMNFDKHPQDQGAMMFLGSIVQISIQCIGIIVALGQLGVDTSVIVGAFSAIGLGISLALKNNMANVAGGIQIVLTKPFLIGDYVEIGTYAGTVTSIDTMFTTLLSVNRQEIVVPNASIISEVVVNYSKEKSRRIQIVLSVSNTTDVKAFMNDLVQIMNEEALLLKDPAPYARVSAFLPNGNGINITAFAFAPVEHYWDILFSLNLKFQQLMQEKQIQQPTDALSIKSVEDLQKP
ncbi:mechanosensitive ion channel family protein [Dubosiella newyorkensis]|uniref:mechanosensitive ion channel family protein n=1 Tax=Dubosiella newyorkensis TaxID=1862672 RepID=UPI00272C3C19|nr:mechanosensitive ion channel family protein [Dubosiella newyorkensis]